MDYKLLLIAAMAVLLLAVAGCGPPARSMPSPPVTEMSYEDRVLRVYRKLQYSRNNEAMIEQARIIVDKAMELEKGCTLPVE